MMIHIGILCPKVKDQMHVAGNNVLILGMETGRGSFCFITCSLIIVQVASSSFIISICETESHQGETRTIVTNACMPLNLPPFCMHGSGVISSLQLLTVPWTNLMTIKPMLSLWKFTDYHTHP